jgi:acyl carrier protein
MTTLGRVQRVLVSRFALREAEMTPGRPMESLGIDSLATLELVLDLEDEFGIRFPDLQPRVATLADLVGIVDRELARKGAPR